MTKATSGLPAVTADPRGGAPINGGSSRCRPKLIVVVRAEAEYKSTLVHALRFVPPAAKRHIMERSFFPANDDDEIPGNDDTFGTSTFGGSSIETWRNNVPEYDCVDLTSNHDDDVPPASGLSHSPHSPGGATTDPVSSFQDHYGGKSGGSDQGGSGPCQSSKPSTGQSSAPSKQERLASFKKGLGATRRRTVWGKLNSSSKPSLGGFASC